MTRVALMHEHSWPTVQRGGERYLHDIAWYLDRHTDLAPSVVTARARPRHDRIEDVPVDRTWIASAAPLGRLARRLPRATTTISAVFGARALRRPDPDVVHALSPAAAGAARRAGVPHVLTNLGAPDAAFARRHPKRWRVLADAAASAATVTAVGREAADGFGDALGREVLALQPGIRMDAFPAQLEARTGPPRVLFASTVTPVYKGFRAVLEALPAIVDAHPAARLVVLGPGDVDGLVDAASAPVRRLRDRIDRHLPPTAEMPDWYGRGTVTVLASRGEAFGLVLAESLACGTPVVASTRGGPAEILEGAQGRVGFSATPHEPDEIAAATIAAIELAAEPTVPRACREHATRWGWVETIGPRHEALYRQVAASR